MKKTIILLCGLCAIPILQGGCSLENAWFKFRQESETLVIAVPEMKSEKCSKIILSQLNRSGIESTSFDLQDHTVTVTFNSTLLAIKNVEYLITGIGFEANGNPPNPTAKDSLPEECR
ncbi:MAG: hypothetical protein GKR87_14980 [Kiritimatiellae bacterium]|nr:hypothetical protein [Kiritimatiellia bacterium]